MTTLLCSRTRGLRTVLRFAACLIAVPFFAGEFSTPVAPSPEDWRAYLAEDTRTHYSPLAQINPSNVARLEKVWTYAAATPTTDNPTVWRSNPLVLAGTLYAATPSNTLVALDADTGTEKWHFDPSLSGDAANPLEVVLGVTAWADGSDARIFFATNDRLHAVESASGRAITSFGRNGWIDLQPNNNRTAHAPTTTAPVSVLGNLLIVAHGASGSVRAFDARSGAPVWTVNRRVDSAQVLAADAARGLLYLTGSDGLLCLEGATGREIWRQSPATGHPPANPAVLFTLHRGGRSMPAIAQATVSGFVHVFHRETGEALLTEPEGYAVIPAQDAKNKAGSPALDPFNHLYLASTERPLAATNLASQEIIWRGHPLTPPGGGDPIVTGGNLVFRGSKEGIHALHASTGERLWTAALSAPPAATPATYRANGRQYLVVSDGPALTAFALPLADIAKPAPVAQPPERFAEEIGRIEARLGKNPPAPGGIVFYGSSTFTLWNIAAAFPDLPVTNLGFGGSQIPDLVHYADRLLLPLRPRLVVFYCGNNDVSSNFSFDEVVGRYRTFTAWMDRHLPDSHVLVLSNLPTPRRWAMWPDLHILNVRLATEIAGHPRHHYLDGTAIMLDPDGRLRRDRISSDNLHMNATGNAALRDALRPKIEAIWATSVAGPIAVTPSPMSR